MDTSYFYLGAEKSELNEPFLASIKNWADQKKTQVYVLNRPLADKKYRYEYPDFLVVLVPKCKIVFVNMGTDATQFETVRLDFIEDLGSISDKYQYRDAIGRPRSWQSEVTATHEGIPNQETIENWSDLYLIADPRLARKCELLISLLTGSINDIKNVGTDLPTSLLDKVKHKIVLFDGDQTRFIYQTLDAKVVAIQGLSGTGKTELLLHKLKDTFLGQAQSKILFTCHNKILADTMLKRIPEFFDFMKVEAQIRWHEALWCVGAWGSTSNPNSGAYRVVCEFYGLSFLTYRDMPSFDDVCKRAISELKRNGGVKGRYAFTHSFIDESQDFSENFIALIEMVTERQVFVAGDIFQSIFDEKPVQSIAPQIVLSKCYRTDPRTLMFAHALGMGLFEKRKLKWLEDQEWRDCGYTFTKEDGVYHLTREPLRRFEDLQEAGSPSVRLVASGKLQVDQISQLVIEEIKTLRVEFPTLTPDDIGVIFVDDSKYIYDVAGNLEVAIPTETGWTVNTAWESKKKLPDKVLISNRNNVKGLEFPFVICVTATINQGYSYRNSLYTMLTRSFLRSILLIVGEKDEETFEKLSQHLSTIQDTGKLDVAEPSDVEKKRIKTSFLRAKQQAVGLYDQVYEIFAEIGVDPSLRKKIYGIVQQTGIPPEDRERLAEFIANTHRIMVPRQNDLL